ncbi:phage tail tape measure protein, partial [Bacillus cereus]|uniref:phage tail tape measure protein n=1 Tax=Bacillus cereus TaxID=1396 RepID=UPI003633A980
IRRAFGETDRIAQQQGRQAGRSFSGAFGTSLKTAGAIAGAAGGFAAVTAAMRSSIGAGMDFTSALNTLQAVSGATAQQVAEVGRRARELGTDSQLASTSSIDAANAMLELAKGGFTVEQSMQAARGTLQLAAAAQISAGEAATIQSQALQAFGKDASYAGKTADILANSANASSAEITDVAQALQQSGTVANQFGLSMTDTAAAISMMANAGIQGSDAGTLLKSALLALTDGGQPAQTAIEQLGLSVYDANGKFAGMETLFGELHAASKRMTPEMYQAATATLFGSDAMRLSGIAAQQGAEGFVSMRAAMDRTGSAADVAAAKMQGLPGAWEKLKNSAQDAGLAFYDVVDGPLTTAANKAADVLGDLVSDAEDAGKGVRDAFDDARVQSFLDSVKNDGASAFAGITAAATGFAPILEQNLQSAATIAGALGVSTWTVLI